MQKKMWTKQKTNKLTKKLDVGNRVLMLTERLNKNDARGKFYEKSGQSKQFLNKDKIFLILINKRKF